MYFWVVRSRCKVPEWCGSEGRLSKGPALVGQLREGSSELRLGRQPDSEHRYFRSWIACPFHVSSLCPHHLWDLLFRQNSLPGRWPFCPWAFGRDSRFLLKEIAWLRTHTRTRKCDFSYIRRPRLQHGGVWPGITVEEFKTKLSLQLYKQKPESWVKS